PQAFEEFLLTARQSNQPVVASILKEYLAALPPMPNAFQPSRSQPPCPGVTDVLIFLQPYLVQPNKP
ncbi:MAG: hypothetical protein IJJ33_04020, partial [Victivallales bacterium]|nr:hypothetical protein [Victivallales bacterium]